MIEVAGGIPVPVPLVEENSFSFNLRAFDSLITDRTKLIILNSPSNPTGGVMPLTDLHPNRGRHSPNLPPGLGF